MPRKSIRKLHLFRLEQGCRGSSWRTPLTALASAALLACGGGGGSGASSNVQAPTVAQSSVSGAVVKGPVGGSTVCVYALTESGEGKQLGCTTSAPDGSYALNLSYTGPVVVEASGGTYTDEATGLTGLVLGTPLLSVGFLSGGSNTLVATPLTALAYSLASAGGNLTLAGFDAAASSVQGTFGLTPTVSLTQVIPVVENGKLNEYGAVLRGISQMLNSGATLKGMVSTNDLDSLKAGYDQVANCSTLSGGYNSTTVQQTVTPASPSSGGFSLVQGASADGSLAVNVTDPLPEWRKLLPSLSGGSSSTMGCTLQTNSLSLVQLNCPATAMQAGISIYAADAAVAAIVPAQLPSTGVLIVGKQIDAAGTLGAGAGNVNLVLGSGSVNIDPRFFDAGSGTVNISGSQLLNSAALCLSGVSFDSSGKLKSGFGLGLGSGQLVVSNSAAGGGIVIPGGTGIVGINQ